MLYQVFMTPWSNESVRKNCKPRLKSVLFRTCDNKTKLLFEASNDKLVIRETEIYKLDANNINKWEKLCKNFFSKLNNFMYKKKKNKQIHKTINALN